MNKGTPKWKNVPAPNVNMQVTLLGSCFQMIPDGSLCVDMESIFFSNAAQSTLPVTSGSTDAPSGKQKKFAVSRSNFYK
jgi:hypothetical protein